MILEKLSALQAQLKAPKSQYNEFGRYKYRKAEDILEAVKPYLSQLGLVLTCTDELIQVGDRYYIKATATLIDSDGKGGQISTTAYAREEAEKKGMDGSQVTGASSSYARKYALNGLLCIDDTQDSDTTNVGDGKPQQKGKKETPKDEPSPIAALTKNQYDALVRSAASGKPSKSGLPARLAFIENVHPTPEDLAAFDKAVEKWQAEHKPTLNA